MVGALQSVGSYIARLQQCRALKRVSPVDWKQLRPMGQMIEETVHIDLSSRRDQSFAWDCTRISRYVSTRICGTSLSRKDPQSKVPWMRRGSWGRRCQCCCHCCCHECKNIVASEQMESTMSNALSSTVINACFESKQVKLYNSKDPKSSSSASFFDKFEPYFQASHLQMSQHC